jgi:hypothetical protein
MAKKSEPEVAEVVEAPEVAKEVKSKPAKVIGECPDEFKKGVAELAGKLGEKEVTIVEVGKHAVIFDGPVVGRKKYPQAE